VQPLCLGIIGKDCTTTHVVASGDSCSSIAQAAGITFSLLLGNNPNIDDNCDNILIDEESVSFLITVVTDPRTDLIFQVLCTANTPIAQ
jgi:hypothetical protein